MEPAIHRMSDLFQQLGLADDASAMDLFITTHRPLPPGVKLADAQFWTPSQAQFLRETIQDDTDWAELVDSLAARLSA